MAGSVNKCILIGNVGKDPEIRAFQNGGEVANFSLATSESWKGKDGQRQERTEWHNIAVTNSALVGVVRQYVKKGGKLYIEGQLQTRKWQDKSGADRYTTEVVVGAFNGRLVLLDTPDKSEGGKPAQASLADDFDTIPF